MIVMVVIGIRAFLPVLIIAKASVVILYKYKNVHSSVVCWSFDLSMITIAGMMNGNTSSIGLYPVDM